MKFSIIVPVYNVESYLVQCVKSVLSQNYDDFEIILIDDGSTDKSGIICDELKKDNDKIKVYHKKNGGLSSARNAGLDLATGDYVIFLDSDDWIDEGCFYNFNNVLQNNPVDLLMTVKTSVYEDKVFLESEDFGNYLEKGFDKDRAVDWILHYGRSVGAPNKIVKKTLIDNHHLRFHEGFLHEDYDWTFKLCLYAQTFAGYTGAWYNYRMVRDGSITNKVTDKNITSLIQTTRIYYDLYIENPDDLHKKIYQRSMNALYLSLNKAKSLPDKDSLNRVIDDVNKNIDMFRYAKKTNQKFFLIVLKIFGAKVAMNLLKILG